LSSQPLTTLSASPITLAIRFGTEIVPLLEAVTTAMTSLGYLARDIFGVRLALEEAIVNALKHGHGYDPSKAAHVRCLVTQEQVVAEIEDEGPGFDPEDVADPLHPENMERSCGRGLLLMRHYLTSIQYNERGNAVILSKCRSRV
jgi:serine/threonine-protein kinase RsbW